MGNKKYYLSAYCSIDPIARVLGVGVRHDQNISLWQYDTGILTLLHHWELERLTGAKHHNLSFENKEAFLEFVKELILPYELKLDDIEQLIGMPAFEEKDPQLSSNISYHAICHLCSSIMMDTDLFYNEKILAFAYDGMPDPVYSQGYQDNFYAGAYSNKGRMDLFPISSPGMLWADASMVFGVPEGTLMALAYATDSCSYEQFVVLDIYNRCQWQTKNAQKGRGKNVQKRRRQESDFSKRVFVA